MKPHRRANRIVHAIVPTGQRAPAIESLTRHVGKDIWYRGAFETPTGEVGGWSDPAKGTVTG